MRTYLVEVRAYPDHRFAASQVGDTMLDILAQVQREDPWACFGFIGAAMLGEDERHGTRRFWLYLRMLRSKLDPNFFMIRDNYATSGIFLLPVHRSAEPDFFDHLRQ